MSGLGFIKRGIVPVAALVTVITAGALGPVASSTPPPLDASREADGQRADAFVRPSSIIRGAERESLPAWVPQGHVSDRDMQQFNERLAATRPANFNGEALWDTESFIGDLSALQLEELVFVANDLDLTVDEVLNRGTYANDIGILAAEWESQPGFGGWGFRDQEPYIIWNGPLPDAVATDLTSVRYNNIHMLQSNFEFQELEKASVNLLEQLVAMQTRPTPTIFVDIDALAAKITVRSSVALPGGEERTETVPSFSVSYIVDPNLSSESSDLKLTTRSEMTTGNNSDPSAFIALRGGANFSGCTSGFTIENLSTGLRRLGTAGHCAANGGSRVYRNHPVDGTGSVTLTSPITYRNDGIDLGHFASVGNNPLATHYYDLDSKRYVTSRGSPGVNQLLSVFGWQTNARKSAIVEVASRSCVGDTSPIRRSLTVMDRTKTTRGDSGGPWFGGTGTAYGVHSGRCTEVNGNSTFTRVHLFYERGWRVLTQSGN